MFDDPVQFDLVDITSGDYEQVIALWNRAGLSVRAQGRDAPDKFAGQMASGVQRVIGFREHDGGLVAVAVLTHDGRKGWINRLAVDPAYRRRGLARGLVAEGERWFVKDLGIEVWAALIESHNQDSQALFDALGFHKHDVVYASKRARPEA